MNTETRLKPDRASNPKGRLTLLMAITSLLSFLLAPGVLFATPVHAAGASGALFGLFPAGNDHSYPLADAFYATGGALDPNLGVSGMGAYLPAMVRWQGANNDVINMYETVGGEASLLAYDLPTTWDTYHSIPMVSWSAITQDQLAASGGYDSYLQGFALTLKQFISGVDANGAAAPAGGRRLFLRPDWEANGNWYGWSPAANASDCATMAQQEANYVAMWRHVHDVVMSAGGFSSSQVSWVFSVNNTDYAPSIPASCANGASDIVPHIYPGDAYVDWVGIDGYNWADRGTQSAATIFGPMVSKLKGLTTRPLSIDEVGTGTQTQPTLAPTQPNNVYYTAAQKGAWIADYFNYLQTAGIKMSLWFNNNKEEDWAVFSQPGAQDPLSRGDSTFTDGLTIYNTYTEYATGVRSTYFISPDQTNPRLLTDAQFGGQ
ncbi:MAG: glycoside hydrolase family 26 protein [Candidatus Dormibacteria bacterium]